jgi:signal transduction histidine kinase
MMEFLIAAIIIFALVKRHRYRDSSRESRHDKWSREWERWQTRANEAEAFGEAHWAKWSHWWHDLERWRGHARDHTRDWERRFERRFGRGGVDPHRERQGWRKATVAASDSKTATSSAEGTTSSSDSESGQPQFRSEQQRASYARARKRAAQEAGFYLHLMWYGIVIGFLLILNLVVSPSLEWWVFPALGWGVGLASHFGAVYGWRWIHQRVFEPAIQREVRREVSLEREVLRTEKQASLDELTATFAHEIRNPIAAARSLVQQMGEDPTSHENVEYAKVALDELARVERSVSHLLKYAKEEDYRFAPVNLAAVLDAALTQMRGKLEAKQVSVSRGYIGGPTVRADAEKLRQVFTNVIDNAVDAMESNAGERRLELWIRRSDPGSATVAIRDNGCGIPGDKIGKIFNPFYTTKQNGTGLGMGIAKKVMDAHHGRIEVVSKVGEGTEFSLSIPLLDVMRSAAESESRRRPVARPQDEALVDAPRATSPFVTSEVDNHISAPLRPDARERP